MATLTMCIYTHSKTVPSNTAGARRCAGLH
uniref:Uncharacterized protein n=1 Tax=Arundo donax TaxID=35708 RepID=A0A0A9FE15_ARUDO